VPVGAALLGAAAVVAFLLALTGTARAVPARAGHRRTGVE
jgi:hypothetical protein